ncbi:MAG: MoaD/ThiS family protein [bacterium]
MPVSAEEQRLKVQYLGLAKNVVGKQEEDVLLPVGSTVRELLRLLAQMYGESFQVSMMNSKGGLRSFVEVWVGGENIAFREGLDTPLAGQDQVVIMVTVAPIAGGDRRPRRRSISMAEYECPVEISFFT